MSIKTRFGLLAGLLLLAFCAALLWLRQAEPPRIAEALQEAREDARRHVVRLIDSDSIALKQLVRDHQRGEVAERVGAAGITTRETRWREVATAYGADAIWLVGADGETELAAVEAVELPVVVRDSVPASRHFFAEISGALWEFVGGPRPAPAPGGWMLAGRRWSTGRVAELEEVLGCTVRLLRGGESLPPAAAADLVVDLPLTGPRGEVVSTLRVSREAEVAAQALRTDGNLVRLFIGFGVLLLAVLGLAVHRWVLRPLDRIGESLVEGNTGPLQGLGGGEEIVRLARLAEDSFERKAQLQREIEERRQAEARLRASQEDLRQSIEVRSRLARNLHDTVIQSIYATGLGIESARSELAVDPAAAAARLAHCRTNLNDAIREVRGFINDLEPESLRRQPFAQALRSLAFTMQSLWVAAINVELDETMAARFSPVQETHVLQIVREAISNALRHGEASQISIRLQADSDAHNALLKIQDNGRGFDAARPAGKGHGLINMTNRAGEMGGSLRLQSELGGGTTIVLRVPVSFPA